MNIFERPMKGFLIICLLFLSSTLFGQRQANHLIIEGTVMGYHYEPKRFFKKEEVQIQGSLSGVKLTAKDETGKVCGQGKTDAGGNFAFQIPLGKKYTLMFSKSGYGKSAITLDLREAGDSPEMDAGLILKNIEFILNDNETGKAIDLGSPFATVTYKRSSNNFTTIPVEYDKKDRLFKEIENSTPVNLLKSSVKKNNGKNSNLESLVNNKGANEDNNGNSNYNNTNNSNNKSEDEVTEETEVLEKKLTILKHSNKFDNVKDWSNLTEDDIRSRSDEINKAWEELEKEKLLAVTEEDFLLIEAKEELLRSAERELDAAKAYIEEQEGKLRAQRNMMILLTIMVVLMGGFVFYLIKSIKEKNQLNTQLDKKNKKILSSINYAERIQKSVLLGDEEIKAIIPNSFVYYEPLDLVSGDFYWFGEVNGKAIVAAVDCTGHGVPGAFMSLIGNTLMNQIINEKKISSPAEILNHLHQGIVKSLKQEDEVEASQDGMDMSLCAIDKNSGEVTFAGAVNPMFVVENGEFKEVSGNIRGVGGVLSKKRKREVNFTEQSFKFEKGSCFYLFSDGYMDQFGDKINEKFNLPRFREMLVEIHKEPMEKQKATLEQTFVDWKGQAAQIDDVLVIGVKL